MKTAFAILLFLYASASFASGQAPVKVRHPAIALYEQAKFDEAIRAFETATKTKEFKSNAVIWNYLGLSYLAKDEVKNSRKAFEKSVSLDPSSAVFRSNLAVSNLMSGQTGKAIENAEKAMALNPKLPAPYEVRGVANLQQHKLDLAERDADVFVQLDPASPKAYLLRSDVLIAKLGEQFAIEKTVKSGIDYLKRAVEALQTAAARCQGASCGEIVRRRDGIAAFYEYFSRDRNAPAPDSAGPTPEPGVTPYKITYQPKARYTDRARGENIQGAIRVALLLGASGKVEHILFLSRLGFGLDQEVITAARQIKFEPKKRDGKPIPVVIVREYTFAIY